MSSRLRNASCRAFGNVCNGILGLKATNCIQPPSMSNTCEKQHVEGASRWIAAQRISEPNIGCVGRHALQRRQLPRRTGGFHIKSGRESYASDALWRESEGTIVQHLAGRDDTKRLEHVMGIEEFTTRSWTQPFKEQATTSNSLRTMSSRLSAASIAW